MHLTTVTLLSIVVAAGVVEPLLAPPPLDEVWRNKASIGDRFDQLKAVTKEVEGKPLCVEVHRLKTDEKFAVFRVSYNGDIVVLPNNSCGADTDLKFFTVKCPDRVLCLPNPCGGNAVNANSCYVLSLEADSNLQLLGHVSSQTPPLSVFDDVFEDGCGVLSHAEAPVIRICIQAKDGKLSMDKVKTAEELMKKYWDFEQELRGLEVVLMYAYSMMDDHYDETNRDACISIENELFQKTLEYCLVCRALASEQSGVAKFKKHVEDYPGITVFSNDEDPRRWRDAKPDKELQQRVIKSLEQSPLDKLVDNILSGERYKSVDCGYAFPVKPSK